MNTAKNSYSLRMLTENRQELYGVATLWIITFHSYLCNVYFPTALGELITYGNMGCELFLFLSGICLYFSYHGEEQYIPFIKRRLVRLYVPIMLICSWYWLYQLIENGLSLPSLGTLAADYLTLSLWLTGDSQIWFVSLLMVVYLLYPCIYRVMSRSRYSVLLLLSGAIGLTLLIKAAFPVFYGHTEVALTRLPIFLIGCYFGQLVYEQKPFPRWVVPLCAAVFCGVIAVLHADILHGICRRYFYLLGGIALTFVLAWLFGKVHRKPFHVIFTFFGNMSLELYLVNIILIRLYRQLPCYQPDRPSAWGYIALLAVNVVLAYIACCLGKRVTARLQRRNKN